jgi:hypothetical protein
VLPQPASVDREPKPGTILLRCPALLKQKLAVDRLDAPSCTASVALALKQFAGGLFRISKWSGLGIFHAAALSSLSAPRATIFMASSANGRCNALRLVPRREHPASRSSSLVSITGIAFG